MPDDRTPENQMHDDLDARIRHLVARAVSDAPAPPDITRRDVAVEPAEPDHRRWWIGGGAAVAAAAAMIVSLVVVTSGDESTEPTTPATQPPPRTTVASPSTTAPAVPAPPPRILTAGARGIVEHRPGEGPHQILSEPAAIALDVGDGSVLFQRVAGWTGEDGNVEQTVPRLLGADGTVTDLFGTADWDGAVTMHDVETVGDSTLLLFALQDRAPSTGATATLYVVDLETQARTEVARDVGAINVRADRLQMATNGLIIGAWSTSMTSGLSVYAVPGSPAADDPLQPGDLGLQEPFEDCILCARSFAMTPDGLTFGWFEGGETSLVIRTLDGSYHEGFEIKVPARATIDASLEIGGDVAVITPEPLNSDRPPVALDLADPTAAPTVLGGGWATIGPAVMTGSTTLPQPAPTSVPGTTTESTVTPGETSIPPTEPPTTTTGPPASGVIDDVVTAGPGGVVAHQGGEALTITTEPMEMALATGDGSYVVQRRSGYGANEGYTAADTMPLILSSDGVLTPIWPGAEPSWITLHDVEVVDGRRRLVYESDPDIAVSPPDVVEEFATSALIADLDDPDAEPVDLGNTSGWEYGVSRLHLATTGLIVGEASESITHHLAVLAVPGSPAAADPLPTAAELGLEDSYSDCNDCPQTFTISPHGTVFAWLDRTPGIDGHTELVVQPADRGDPQRFDPFPDDINTTLIDDLDYLAEGGQLLSYRDPTGDEPRAPVYIAGDGSVRELAGVVATADPIGS